MNESDLEKCNAAIKHDLISHCHAAEVNSDGTCLECGKDCEAIDVTRKAN